MCKLKHEIPRKPLRGVAFSCEDSSLVRADPDCSLAPCLFDGRLSIAMGSCQAAGDLEDGCIPYCALVIKPPLVTKMTCSCIASLTHSVHALALRSLSHSPTPFIRSHSHDSCACSLTQRAQSPNSSISVTLNSLVTRCAPNDLPRAHTH